MRGERHLCVAVAEGATLHILSAEPHMVSCRNRDPRIVTKQHRDMERPSVQQRPAGLRPAGLANAGCIKSGTEQLCQVSAQAAPAQQRCIQKLPSSVKRVSVHPDASQK